MKAVSDVNPQEQEETLQSCNFIRVILMLAVVLYHSTVFWGGTWFVIAPAEESPVLVAISNWLKTFDTCGFTFLSGYIFYYCKIEQKRYGDFGHFIKNKAMRLMLPALCIGILWIAPIRAILWKMTLGNVFKNFILGISPGPLWFLWMLFGVFCIFWYFINWYCKNEICGLAISAAMYFLGG